MYYIACIDDAKFEWIFSVTFNNILQKILMTMIIKLGNSYYNYFRIQFLNDIWFKTKIK